MNCEIMQKFLEENYGKPIKQAKEIANNHNDNFKALATYLVRFKDYAQDKILKSRPGRWNNFHYKK